MESDDVIKEIVARVVNKLSEGGQNPVDSVGPGRGGGRNSRQASSEVRGNMASVVGGNMSGFLSKNPVSPALSAGRYTNPVRGVSGAGDSCLVVFTAGDGCLDEVHRQMARLSERFSEVLIFLSPSAVHIIDIPGIRRVCSNARLLPDKITHEMRPVVEKCSAVYFPTLTLSTASKMSFLDGDSAASLMGIFALMRGKPVIAACNSLFGVREDYPSVPAGFKTRVDKIIRNLEEVGVKLVDIREMAQHTTESQGQVKGRSPESKSNPSSATVLLNPSVEGPCGGDAANCTACGQCAEMNQPGVQNLVNSGAARIAAAPGTKVQNAHVAGMIDHTLLKPDATEEQVRKLCSEAERYNFASVCVNPSNVALAARLLRNTGVKVCTVIGFPLGATTPTAKGIEARDAIANGATELDMVINVGALKSGDDDLVRRDIEAVVDAARGQALVKVILETALLSDEEKVKACLLAKMAGADFVKTSTGFASGGATVEDIALMRETVGPEMGVKASGGIRDLETAREMVKAGATRIGASASVAIAKGETSSSGGY